MTIIAAGNAGVLALDGPDWTRLSGAACACVAADGQRLACFGEKTAFMLSKNGTFAFSPPPGVCRAFFCGDSLYALSSDGDGVYRLNAATGEPLVFSPAGCFPRDIALSPCGRYIAVAGGAGGEAAVLEADSLRPVHVARLPGSAVGARFFGSDLFVLCRKEGETAALYAVKKGRAVCRRVFSEAPCALGLCAGRLAAGFFGGVELLGEDCRPRRVLECPLPLRIADAPGGALIADASEDRILLLTPRGVAAAWRAPMEPLDAAFAGADRATRSAFAARGGP